jgi:hypothetical protein
MNSVHVVPPRHITETVLPQNGRQSFLNLNKVLRRMYICIITSELYTVRRQPDTFTHLEQWHCMYTRS